jgi:hypothetical protein
MTDPQDAWNLKGVVRLAWKAESAIFPAAFLVGVEIAAVVMR